MSAAPAPLAVLPGSGEDTTAARALACRLALPLLPAGADPRHCDRVASVVLEVAGQRLSLRRTGRHAPGPVQVDFGSAGMRHRRRAGHNELLGRAVGVGKKSPLTVLDATAGLGRDSFVLADLGCEVLLCEREPVMAAMLEWGLRAAASDDPWLGGVLRRMALFAGDARDVEPQRLATMDVIYLDPMFPARDRRAGVKKEMALFQQLLERADAGDDAAALLQWARGSAAARVVLKRPLRAPPLAGQEPSHSIAGKAVRFDVYVRRALA